LSRAARLDGLALQALVIAQNITRAALRDRCKELALIAAPLIEKVKEHWPHIQWPK